MGTLLAQTRIRVESFSGWTRVQDSVSLRMSIGTSPPVSLQSLPLTPSSIRYSTNENKVPWYITFQLYVRSFRNCNYC